jgi:FMN phosphatase YigB (HAD superfamily)
MPLTLEQYAAFLDTREDLNWPVPPPVSKPKARPHLVRMPLVRAVAWDIYGTLLHIFTGNLLFQHPQKFVMDIALDKTVQEFKMWGSMSRKPGQPSEYMGQIYEKVLADQRLASSHGEKYPEIYAEKIWEAIVKKLFQKDYKFDTSFFGPLNEYSRKIAYFFHASLQGTACHEGAAPAVEQLQSRGIKQGLIADAQCFTMIQLQRGLAAQHYSGNVNTVFAANLRALSCEQGGKKPSERLFRHFVSGLSSLGLAPPQVLYIGTSLPRDLAPAKKLGMRTGLFAGDKDALQATPEQLKDPATKPDILLTDLAQVLDVVGA